MLRDRGKRGREEEDSEGQHALYSWETEARQPRCGTKRGGIRALRRHEAWWQPCPYAQEACLVLQALYAHTPSGLCHTPACHTHMCASADVCDKQEYGGKEDAEPVLHEYIHTGGGVHAQPVLHKLVKVRQRHCHLAHRYVRCVHRHHHHTKSVTDLRHTVGVTDILIPRINMLLQHTHVLP